MLSENLKNLRKSKGLTQDELAIKLNVVRQTISKWEKGLSVPDSEMLIRIADELDTSVNVLLGETVTTDDETQLEIIAAKLELLNDQFAKRNETRRKIWRIIFIVIIVLAAASLMFELIDFMHYRSVMDDINTSTAIIGGADGPTNIFVSNVSFDIGSFIASIVAAIVSVVGIYKTRRK